MYLVNRLNHVLGTNCKGCDQYVPLHLGGSGETRTRDQRIKSPLLYRLSYRPSVVLLDSKLNEQEVRQIGVMHENRFN